MSDIKNDIDKLFGGKLRVRVSGLCIRDNSILLVNHKGLGKDNIFWAPPGGGMNFGYSTKENLFREFKEETGLTVDVGEFLFVHEYLNHPLHAIELFFKVEISDGVLEKGNDPEVSPNQQIIDDVKFLNWEVLKKYENSQLHQILSYATDLTELFNLKGYFKFENNYIK